MQYRVIKPIYGFSINNECPVVVERGNFLMDQSTGNIFLQLKFVNYGLEKLQSINVHGQLLDENKDSIPDSHFDWTFSDVNCNQNEAFGSKQLIPVATIGSFVFIDEINIVYGSGDKWSWNGDISVQCISSDNVQIPVQFQSVIGVNNKIITNPVIINNQVHRCCCGALALNNHKCNNCGRTLQEAEYAVTSQGMQDEFNRSIKNKNINIAGYQRASDNLLSNFNNLENTSKIITIKPIIMTSITAILFIAATLFCLIGGMTIFGSLLVSFTIAASQVVVVMIMCRQYYVAIGIISMTIDTLFGTRYNYWGMTVLVIAGLIIYTYYIKRFLAGYNISNNIQVLGIVLFCGTLLVSHLFNDFILWGGLATLTVFAIPVAFTFMKNTKHRFIIAGVAAVYTIQICLLQFDQLSQAVWLLLCWACYEDMHNYQKTSTVNDNKTYRDVKQTVRLSGKAVVICALAFIAIMIVQVLVSAGQDMDNFWFYLTGYGTFQQALGIMGVIIFVLYCVPIGILFIKNAVHKWQITAAQIVAFLFAVFALNNSLVAILCWLITCALCFAERRNYKY